MKKALGEIGFRKALRFGIGTLQSLALTVSLVPPIRHALLRLFGASVGSACVVHGIKFFNLYRGGFAAFAIGDSVFIGDECLFDLADHISLEDQVSLGERVVILTHTNVGYRDHPLQSYFPPKQAPVRVLRGSFVGAGATIMPGVTIGPEAFVAAGAVVTEDVGTRELVAGVPARLIRSIGADDSTEIHSQDVD